MTDTDASAEAVTRAIQNCSGSKWISTKDMQDLKDVAYALSAERDALRAEVATMREALVEVHDDCVERAKMSRDGRTVPIGVSSWMAICNALFPDDAALKTPTSNTNTEEG